MPKLDNDELLIVQAPLGTQRFPSRFLLKPDHNSTKTTNIDHKTVAPPPPRHV